MCADWGRTNWVNNHTFPIWQLGPPSYRNSFIKEMEPDWIFKGE